MRLLDLLLPPDQLNLECLVGLPDPLLQQHPQDLLLHWFLLLPPDLLNLEFLGDLPDPLLL